MMVDFPIIYLLAWGVRQPKIYRELEDQGKGNIRHIYIIYQKIYIEEYLAVYNSLTIDAAKLLLGSSRPA